MKRAISFLSLVLFLVGCPTINDPVVYVDGQLCDDGNGHHVPLMVGFQCCTDGNGGQCEESEMCWGADQCTEGPGPNDPTEFGARRTHPRSSR